MEEATLSIGEVAQQAGLRTSAVRYYERVGLLPTPPRAVGQRRYTEATLERLRIIETGKRAGFSLGEIRTLLTAADEGVPHHEQLRALAARKLPDVEALIERAEAMRRWLVHAGACECRTIEECPLFDEEP